MRLSTTLLLALLVPVAMAQTATNPAAIPGHPIVSDSTSLPFAGPTGAARQHIQRIDSADPTSANLLQEVDAVLAEYQWQMRAHRQSTSRRRN